ncbi:MAG: PrsW family glutamic-type intramembrane protease [Patescibacteria group bacterium]
MLTNDPKILGLAFLGGIIPSLLWLWFWLKEESKKPEPKGILIVVFIAGMISVIFVIQIQKFIQTQISSPEGQIVLWASAEEIIKYLAVMAVLYRTNYINEAIKWPIYLITAALGFATLENTLFLIKPLSLGQNTVGLLTGGLRFLGSTLLHTVSSGILGVALGISLHLEGFKRKLYPIIGLIFAIALHSVFNFLIIRNGENDILKVFSFLWVVTIIVMLLFEKVRRMD